MSAVNLHQMLRLYGPLYLKIARIHEEYNSSYRMVLANPAAIATSEDLTVVLQNLRIILDTCQKMNFPVAHRSLEKIIDSFERTAPSLSETKEKIMSWYSCFESEMESHLYLQVLPHRISYWSSKADDIMGSDIHRVATSLDRFPHSAYEAIEAGNCFAYERFTAAVYHLMRCAEFGLIAVARSAGVLEEKINKGWDGCIQGIESHIKTVGSTKPTADWQTEIKKYSEICAWFTSIQKGWRNPVSHAPRTYSEQIAKAMFGAVETLFGLLRHYSFRQTEMPNEIKLPGVAE